MLFVTFVLQDLPFLVAQDRIPKRLVRNLRPELAVDYLFLCLYSYRLGHRFHTVNGPKARCATDPLS